MPPPRTQNDFTRGQPEDGDHRASLCPGSPCQLHLPMPPSRTAGGHKQGQTSFIQSIYIRFFYIAQHRACARPTLPFLLTLTAHPAGDGKVNTAPPRPPTDNKFVQF